MMPWIQWVNTEKPEQEESKEEYDKRRLHLSNKRKFIEGLTAAILQTLSKNKDKV